MHRLQALHKVVNRYVTVTRTIKEPESLTERTKSLLNPTPNHLHRPHQIVLVLALNISALGR